MRLWMGQQPLSSAMARPWMPNSLGMDGPVMSASENAAVVAAAGHGTGQQGAGHALADAALAGNDADDLFDAAVGVGGIVLRSGIAGRTGCTAIGAVMGTFFAHSLCRARRGRTRAVRFLPCSKYGRGLAPCLTTV